MKNQLFVSAFAVILIFFTSCNKKETKIQGRETGIYFQEVKNSITLPGVNAQNIIKLFRQNNQIIAVSPGSVYYFNNNRWEQKTVRGNWQTACLDSQNKLWLGSLEKIYSPDDNTELSVPAMTKVDTIFCLLWENDKNLYAGTDKGCWKWNGNWSLIKNTENSCVRQITKGKDNDLWLATSNGIIHRQNDEWVNLNDYVMAPGLGRNFVSITNGATDGDVIFGSSFAVSQISEKGNHWCLTKEDGLPIGPVTTICYVGDEIWMGTPDGAIRKSAKWHYYHGKRWLPDNKINDILPLDEQTVWIATPQGISEIKQVEITLAQKSDRFEDRLNQRHLHHGFVSECNFDSPGDTASWKCHTNDNDGLWTSIYLAAESFRYAVTGGQDAYNNAVRTFDAMEKLETVNPIPGFVARSYVTADESTGRGGEWHLSTDGKWKWKGDTSSDEIVGHMFAYPIFYELAAKGEVKERAKNLVHRLMSHIVDNNFQLIDLDGKPTRWGVWCPDSLNNSLDWWYERGINSLQILSFLESAYYVTGDEKFDKAIHQLVEKHHYAENMVQQKMYFPYEINHSDDELAFLPYYCLLRYVRDSESKKIYQKSMARSWTVEQPDRNPLWNIIASTALDKECDIDVAVNELQDYPLDIIEWGMQNSQRWDLRKNPIADRFLRDQATTAIPVAERGISKWNSNPYKFDYNGNGTNEDDGAAWLLPYWMGRYHRFF